jgi:hypothetical protein
MTPQPVFEAVLSIPLWLVREYLTELNGVPTGEDAVSGDGWQARLTRIEDAQIGSLRVGRVRLELYGDPAAIQKLLPALEKKLLRAGG